MIAIALQVWLRPGAMMGRFATFKLCIATPATASDIVTLELWRLVRYFESIIIDRNSPVLDSSFGLIIVRLINGFTLCYQVGKAWNVFCHSVLLSGRHSYMV